MSSNGNNTKCRNGSTERSNASTTKVDDRSELKKDWFSQINETLEEEVEEISDCPGGICPVPWAKAKNELAPGVKEPEISVDNVNHPSHYTADGSIECIEAIEAQLTPEEYRGYLKGNVAKYVWREKHKGGIESLKKAEWYLKRLIDQSR
ncbi:MAG: hypothetical protein Tp158DCM1229571_45 [Prokaryotic dsDNA virus sp.]|nr:MAG: hypothetical protein Tp158DCM1229571_45 [Prokaryotic dsDNA virus sp.]|tara:strand:+ start:47293 stop:47742 length:450 start_codon:yes stop_codon:yes gene_type:complete